jgi:hypothetical protein
MCACGRRNAADQDFCVECAVRSTRAGPPDGPDKRCLNKKACEGCGGPFRLWVEVTQGEDGLWRCPTCHLDYLQRRMEADPIEGPMRFDIATFVLPLVRKKTPPLPRELELNRPAWSPAERAQRAQAALAAYRQHLVEQGGEVPF